ncbi:cupredoxin domain-containing protein [Nostoc sp. NIES-2111]
MEELALHHKGSAFMSRPLFLASACLAAALLAAPASAEDTPDAEITLSGDVFNPREVRVPAGRNLVLKFVNGESAPAEIEGKELKIEKVVPAGGTIIARVKALKPGRYLFVNEYREDVAKGYVVAE